MAGRMLIKDTTLTAPLAAWLRWAADDDHTLNPTQAGPDIDVPDTTPAETDRIIALLAAHAADPFTTCPKDQP